MGASIKLTINENLFVRNPVSTKIGQGILKDSILLLDEIGFEQFTFKKLAKKTGTTEATVYRYFDNKHNLLIYLINWYWEWMNFLIDYHCINIENPKKKLSTAIACVVNTARRDASIEFVDEDVLHKIVITEGTKAYHNKAVDEQNRQGYFKSYKSLCQKIADIILEIKPDFKYPRALATNTIEMAQNNIYCAMHLPKLTDVKVQNDDYIEVTTLVEYFVFQVLGESKVDFYQNGMKEN